MDFCFIQTVVGKIVKNKKKRMDFEKFLNVHIRYAEWKNVTQQRTVSENGKVLLWLRDFFLCCKF